MALSAIVSDETDDALTLTWDDAPALTTDIQITGGGLPTSITAVANLSITLSGLTPLTAYSLTVSALSSIGAVLQTFAVVGTTLEEEEVVVPPVAFTVTCSASDSDSDSVTLSWTGAPAGTTQINLAVDGGGNRNASWITSPIVYADLDADTSYSITAEARNTAGTVLATDTLTCSTLEDFTISPTVSDLTVFLGWPAIASAASYTYTITRDSDASVFTTVTTAALVVSVAIPNNGTAYTVTVEARSGAAVVLRTNTGAFTSWDATSITLEATLPKLSDGDYVAGSSPLTLTARSSTTSSLAVSLDDPSLPLVTEYRVYLIGGDLTEETPAEPIMDAYPDTPVTVAGGYYGSVAPVAFPITLNLIGLTSATFYGVYVAGLNAAGEAIAIGATGASTS